MQYDEQTKIRKQIELYEVIVQRDNEAREARRKQGLKIEGTDFDQVCWYDRALLRYLYILDDRPVCEGGFDCLEKPTRDCRAGKHKTCATHADACFSCRAESSRTNE